MDPFVSCGKDSRFPDGRSKPLTFMALKVQPQLIRVSGQSMVIIQPVSFEQSVGQFRSKVITSQTNSDCSCSLKKDVHTSIASLSHVGTQIFGFTLISTSKREQMYISNNLILTTKITTDLSEFAEYVYIIQLPEFPEEKIFSHSEPQLI